MAIAMMAYMYLTGRSVWTNPDLIAAMWMGNALANGSFARRFSDALGDERADGHPRRAVHQEFVFRADGFDRDCLLNKKNRSQEN